MVQPSESNEIKEEKNSWNSESQKRERTYRNKERSQRAWAWVLFFKAKVEEASFCSCSLLLFFDGRVHSHAFDPHIVHYQSRCTSNVARNCSFTVKLPLGPSLLSIFFVTNRSKARGTSIVFLILHRAPWATKLNCPQSKLIVDISEPLP